MHIRKNMEVNKSKTAMLYIVFTVIYTIINTHSWVRFSSAKQNKKHSSCPSTKPSLKLQNERKWATGFRIYENKTKKYISNEDFRLTKFFLKSIYVLNKLNQLTFTSHNNVDIKIARHNPLLILKKTRLIRER